jgi:hypothetical protein
MAVIETKYSVGDVVWHASTSTERKQHPCPDCNNTRKWKAVSPAGNEYEFRCPRCATRFQHNDILSLEYSSACPLVHKRTIGSVRHDSHKFGGGSETEYMCLETGVGSGNLYNEESLFASEAEALSAAQAMADKSNETTEWIVTLYNKTLELSDYQFENALIKQASDAKIKAGSLLWNLNDLFGTIDEAEDKDAILEAIDDYKKFSWERDKERAKAAS